MKFFISILILSIITYTNEEAPELKALIETAATKTAFATTDEINVKITNTGDATATAGAVSGLSLVAASVSKTVALTCATPSGDIAATESATVVCKPGVAESTAGVYVLTANSAKVGSVDLTVDTDNSKSITISASAKSDADADADAANATNSTNTTNTTTTNNNNNTEAGNYLKISFILLAIALLF